MLNFKEFVIKEQNEVSHDVTFARMNPMHVGHQTVVDQVVNSANQNGGGHTVFLSRSQDKKKNPLTPEQKLHFARKSFPNANVQLTDSDAPTLLHQASKLHQQGVTKLNLHVGSDRVDDFRNILNNYNGTEGKHGYFNFNDINVLPVGGDRSDASDDVEGASATKMRNAAQDLNSKVFHKMAPTALSKADKDELMSQVHNGMNPPPVVNKQLQTKKKENVKRYLGQT